MIKALRCLGILFAAVLIVTGNLCAADEKPQPSGRGGFAARRPDARLKTQMLADKLVLTEEQQGKVKAILERSIAKITEVIEDKSLAKEDRRVKILEVRNKETEEIRALLTPQQREKFKELLPPENDGGGEKKPTKAKEAGKAEEKPEGK